jgi:hypothetical protein
MQREACLRSEFANLYSSLIPGRWYTAAAVAGQVKGTSIVTGGSEVDLSKRVLNEEHFLFRGGRPRQGIWLGMRTRRVDRWFPDNESVDRSGRLRVVLAG